MDMRHSTAVTGGPENAFFAQASAALGRFYRLPSASWASTEALLEDEQAALEKMFALQTHTAAGVSLVWGLGQLESEMTLSLAQLVIDDEMVAFVRRFRRGFGTGEADVAFDLIREVGIAGSFLETEHTLRHHRHAVFTPHLLNRRARWGGAEPLPHAARCRARALLEGDTAPRISEAEAAELRRVEEHFRGDEA
jgi:trimethylamine--corrinoid protein Co-methyltransferase